jgi:1-acyl-sn-glycerol-3-phosphate acyltransferase
VTSAASLARPRAGELLLWRLLFPLVRRLGLFLVPVRVEGGEHLPRSGGYLLVSNHLSWIDPPWLEFVIARPIRYLAKRELFAVPVVGWLLLQSGVVPIERDTADHGALRRALSFLASGEVVGIFPEGHRSRTGALLRGRAGVAFIARRSGALVVPVGFDGSDRAGFGRFWDRKVTIRFGEPFRAPDLAAADEPALTDAIMRRIAVLLPAERRGPYGG